MTEQLKRWVRPQVPPRPAGAGEPTLLIQRVLAVATLALSLATVSPLGITGAGLWGSVLLAANVVVSVVRMRTPARASERRQFAVALVGAVAAGLLYAHDPASWGVAYAYVVAINAGSRLPTGRAVVVATLVSAVGVLGLVLHPNVADFPLWPPLTAGACVAFGIARRSRAQALEAMSRLVEQTQRAAQADAHAATLAERARVAREIHDLLAHSLSGVNLQLEVADALFDKGRDVEARDRVRSARSLVVEGLVEARRAVGALREDTLELVPALEHLVAGHGEQLHVVGVVPDLGTERAQTVIRVAQEALTNARRHAPGARLSVRLESDTHDSRLLLMVVNAAPNRAADAAPDSVRPASVGGGMGLLGMRERAALVGATVTAGPVTTDDALDPAWAGGWLVVLTLAFGTTGTTTSADRPEAKEKL
ncbi:MAG: histidine kinase [Humibacillus sp.]|nr:histidine kinase [Humibacillus sp.]MDN5775842.1 histidine kinase [Humibacillus sp.]